MKVYLELLKKIKDEGHDHPDRTGVGRRSIFCTQSRFDISDGTLPVVTTRKIYTDAIIKELLFFIKGDINVTTLKEQQVNIWNQWAVSAEAIEKFVLQNVDDPGAHQHLINMLKEKHENSIGMMYGAMWRNAPQSNAHSLWPTVPLEDIPSDKLENYTKEYEEIKFLSREPIDFTLETFCTQKYYESVDQLNDLIRGLKKRPYSARHIVSAWIPSHLPFEDLAPEMNVLLDRGCLAPCHAFFQCFVSPPKEEGGKKRLSLMMLQRSVDFPVGSAFNIGQYALLLAMLAHVTDMEAYEFIWNTGDTHIYLNQLPMIDEQLSREPLPLPKLWLNPEVKDIFKFTFDDIKILDYVSHPPIKYPVAK
jgi:thymidylate synthase